MDRWTVWVCRDPLCGTTEADLAVQPEQDFDLDISPALERETKNTWVWASGLLGSIQGTGIWGDQQGFLAWSQ